MGILLHQGFRRPILPIQTPERSKRGFVDKIGRGNSCGQVFFFPQLVEKVLIFKRFCSLLFN